jgi:hypothetical protein
LSGVADVQGIRWERVEKIDSVKELSKLHYIKCLMSNHFHLLVETPKPNLSGYM